MTVYDPPATEIQKLTVRALLDDPALELNVRLVAGAAGLEREINHPRIQKSGLAMVGPRAGAASQPRAGAGRNRNELRRQR